MTNNHGFRFKNWGIYDESREFRSEVKRVSKTFPKEEQSCLVDQIRRASTSVVLNIAEGANKITGKDRRLYMNRAHCSLDEVVACLDCAFDDGYISEIAHDTMLVKAKNLAKKLRGFIAHLSKVNCN